MSESKAKLQQEVDRLRNIAYEAGLLLDIVDGMDYDDQIERDMLDRLRKAMYGEFQQQASIPK